MTPWRTMLLGCGFGLLIDVAAAYVIVNIIAPDGGDRLLAVAVIVAVAWAVQIYAGAKQAAVHYLYKNEAGAKAIAAMLSGEGFPKAAKHDDANRYLDRLATSFDDEHGIRERAIFLRGERAGFLAGAGMAKAYAFQRTWDRAIHLID